MASPPVSSGGGNVQMNPARLMFGVLGLPITSDDYIRSLLEQDNSQQHQSGSTSSVSTAAVSSAPVVNSVQGGTRTPRTRPPTIAGVETNSREYFKRLYLSLISDTPRYASVPFEVFYRGCLERYRMRCAREQRRAEMISIQPLEQPTGVGIGTQNRDSSVMSDVNLNSNTEVRGSDTEPSDKSLMGQWYQAESQQTQLQVLNSSSERSAPLSQVIDRENVPPQQASDNGNNVQYPSLTQILNRQNVPPWQTSTYNNNVQRLPETQTLNREHGPSPPQTSTHDNNLHYITGRGVLNRGNVSPILQTSTYNDNVPCALDMRLLNRENVSPRPSSAYNFSHISPPPPPVSDISALGHMDYNRNNTLPAGANVGQFTGIHTDGRPLDTGQSSLGFNKDQGHRTAMGVGPTCLSGQYIIGKNKLVTFLVQLCCRQLGCSALL